MAKSAPYKQYTRNQRHAILDTDFSKGMMAANSVIDEGYVKSLVNFTFEKENGSLIPRPALRPYQILMPDMTAESIDPDSPWLSDGVTIKDVKECVEDGVTYYQIILGYFKSDNKGLLAVVTVEKTDAVSAVLVDDTFTFDVRYGSMIVEEFSSDVLYYSSVVPQIHDIILAEDYSKRMNFPVGSFAYGNSYYFFSIEESDTIGQPDVKKFYKTVFDNLQSPPRYVFREVEPKEPTVSEAVTYGYNMLHESPYAFSNELSTDTPLQFSGILPYEVGTGQTRLMMTPKKNQPLDLVCYIVGSLGRKYDFVWEWREVTASDWTPLQRTTVTLAADTKLLYTHFQPPASEIMVRVSAYPYVTLQGTTSETVSEDVEKAMVVGFDFTIENYGSATALEQEVYDLSTSTGMEVWNNRIVLWGLPKDPTVLFISDYNEPSYFPYPNNIVVFDEPIIYAIEFMDTLCVFTTNKLYQVTLADDGNSWKSTVIQSHLSINAWDKHLIQTVRNMLYFKSGNYYYMMVPKAQSLTGELTLAPITTPITSFFDNFSVNVQNILKETYDYTEPVELLSYYNYLDYEDVHNIYLYKFNDTPSLLHFDVIYNTVDRTWKIWTYESAQILYPFKHNATESGLLAVTSLIDARSDDALDTENPRRIIQLFCWDKNVLRGGYIPNMTRLFYDSEEDSAQVDSQTVEIPGEMAHVEQDDDHNIVVIEPDYADAYDSLVVIIGATGYYSGFSVSDISKTIQNVYLNGEEYFKFRNFQFLDTGYRDDELQAKKRYRELQLLIDNLDKQDMSFGMEFLLDGAPRKIFYKYDPIQTIDEFDPEYGVIYLESTPYLEVELNNIDNTNQWSIDQHLTPEVAFWKVRTAISGKGSAPRLKLFSQNEKRFGLLSINWISRLMHMR